MRAEIVAVGTELLLGQIADTNAQWMSQRLAEIGVDVVHHQAVGDNQERIVATLRLAASRADVVLVCGGLGPTEDDITRDALAELAGVALVFHDELETMLRAKFRRWSAIGAMPESNLRQASVPEGARWIVPDRGTAPGLVVHLPEGARVYAVPGVPDEMREMLTDPILPELRAMAGGDVIASRVLRVAGLGESAVAERLADLFASAENPTIAYLASMGEVKVRLTAKAATAEGARALLAPLVAEVRRAPRRPRVQPRGRVAGGDRAAPARGHTAHACVRGVADGRRRRPAPDERPRRVGVVRRLRGRLQHRGETTGARRL